MARLEIGAVLIAGPTASGKSALALDARARGSAALIVNADSMQVYRDLRILTARPTPEEEAQAPHRLYGHVDGAVNFSVGRYLRDAAAVLAETRAARRLPIFVGGTGLYFKALRRGPLRHPGRARRGARARPRREPRAATARRSTPSSRGAIRRRRCASGRATACASCARSRWSRRPGSRSSSFQGRRRPGLLGEAASVRLFLAPDRDALRRRIDARFVAMIDGGAIEEVRALATRRLDPMLPAMRAHGVPGLLAHLRGEITLDRRSPAARATRAATPSASSPGSATRCRAGPPSRRRRRRRRSTT